MKINLNFSSIHKFCQLENLFIEGLESTEPTDRQGSCLALGVLKSYQAIELLAYVFNFFFLLAPICFIFHNYIFRYVSQYDKCSEVKYNFFTPKVPT